MTRSRLWIFRFISIVFVPALFFLILEAGLRAFDYGYPTDYTISARSDGDSGSFRDNEKFAWRFFPASMARYPSPFKVPVEKDPDGFRIAVLGASAAQGDPDHRFGLARILEAQLRYQYPDVNFEVINSAITATNSHVVLEIARDLAEHDVDLFIVYLGNNEVVGPFGAGTAFAPYASSLAFIRASIALQRTRTGQLINSLVKGATFGTAPQPEWLGMEMMIDNHVRISDPKLEKVYEHFQRNLEDILAEAGRYGAPVLLSTVATNLRDSPPFASLNDAELSDAQLSAWQGHYQEGVERESAGDCTAALDAYRAAERIDSTHADLNFRIARCSETTGNQERSRAYYVKARDLDVLRFRADSRINEIIRTVAAERAPDNVHLVDSVDAFAANSLMSVPGDESFLEHVHLNFPGNYLLASTLLRQIEVLLPGRIQAMAKHPERLPIDGAMAALGFTEFARYLMDNNVHGRFQIPPFTNQIYSSERLSAHGKQLAAIRQKAFSPASIRALENQYRSAVAGNQNDPWLRSVYGDFLFEIGFHERAAEQYRRALEILPHAFELNESLSRALLRSERYEDAVAQARQTLEMRPFSYSARMNLAWALARQGEWSEARALFGELIDRFPSRADGTYVELAQALLDEGKTAEALVTLQNVLDSQTEPGRHQVRAAYMMTRASKTLYERTADVVVRGALKQLETNPHFAIFAATLGTIHEEQGRSDEAIEQYARATRLDPGMSRLYFSLLNLLVRQKRADEALEVARGAADAMDALDHAELSGRFRQAIEQLRATAAETAD